MTVWLLAFAPVRAGFSVMVTVLSLHFEHDMAAVSPVAAAPDLDCSNLVAPFSCAKALEAKPATRTIANAMVPAVRILMSEPEFFILNLFVFGNHDGCLLDGITPLRSESRKNFARRFFA